MIGRDCEHVQLLAAEMQDFLSHFAKGVTRVGTVDRGQLQRALLSYAEERVVLEEANTLLVRPLVRTNHGEGERQLLIAIFRAHFKLNLIT